MLANMTQHVRIQRIYIDQVALAHALACGTARLGSSRARPSWSGRLGEQGALKRTLQRFARACAPT